MQVSIVISLDCDLETHYMKKAYGLVRNIFCGTFSSFLLVIVIQKSKSIASKTINMWFPHVL